MAAALSMEAAMATRRKKPTALTNQEIAELLDEAERFHGVLCRPLIHPSCEHYRMLSRLNEAVHDMVREITGREPPWMTRGSLRPMG
jgi:hypothetical protein